jgi:hypothetical protein
LISPKDTNGADSAVVALGVPLSPAFYSKLHNSVADTYSGQVGIAMKVPGTWDNKYLKGLRVRFIAEAQGLKAYDLFGGNHGVRQPGWGMSVGPSVTYSYGKHFFIVDVPIVFSRHIDPGATVLPGPAVISNGLVLPAPFNANRQFGMVAPLSLSVRYVRSL